MDKPDYILDLSSLSQAGHSQPSPSPASQSREDGQPNQPRPWIAVHWKCCQTYSRIYRNKAGSAYEGRCPKCGSPVRAAVGQGGTSHRFFEAQ